MDAPSTLLYLTLPSASASGAVSVEFPAKICYNGFCSPRETEAFFIGKDECLCRHSDQLPMPVLHRPLHYSGASGKLECDYCGSSYSVAEIEALYKEKEAKAAEAFETADTAAQSGDDSSAWDTASHELRLGRGRRPG